ncbi:sulfide/dihydroorotate dehydrogenase-like FAD/NAD-binding protein [Clostridium sp. BJN0001]|uniref:sulfide/dihydroorotate dehydrogenase-like FAD/NAD-binding protein n=1 Tax=Clostridium sp. BJN0001 TaxID=2930219 RepID=UPI001FD0E6C0|nr:sulfide/dihydroorotate dehydrogenase-like FAD/NAD-binding protein [Clostridium sp. BJN0001]
MTKHVIDCIDCGTEFCPCKLAETNECIICSQCQGKNFCDCLNWKGVCVFQEFYNNGYKAKPGRKIYSCKICDMKNSDDNLIMFKIEIPHKLAIDLKRPGTYIFLRTDENQYFDIPISISKTDIDNDIIMVVIEIKGIKTKKLLNYKTGDNILLRGPYFNGVFGINNILKSKSEKSLILAKGIGYAPSIPVIERLISNSCSVSICIDKSPFNEILDDDFFKNNNLKISYNSLLKKGNLTEIAKALIEKSIDSGITHIHIAGADILTYSVINYLDSIDRKDIKLSCLNNFKMCCGEGICGACTVRYKNHKIRRYCKEQADVRDIFEGRRLI